MSTWSVKAWALRCVALAVAAQAAALGAKSASGYLPRIGPTPLRLVPVKTEPPQAVLPPLAVDDRVEEPSQPEPIVQHAFNLNDYLDSNLPLWTGLAEAIAKRVFPDPGTEKAPKEPLPAVSPPNDMVVVTPQMLVDYFRPIGSATNAPEVSVTVPVGFMPPAIPAPSRATYSTP